MNKAHKLEEEARKFLNQLVDQLHHLPKEYETLKQLAKEAGLSPTCLSDYKNQKRLEEPKFIPIYKLFRLLTKAPLLSFTPDPDDLLVRRFQALVKKTNPFFIAKVLDFIDKVTDEHCDFPFLPEKPANK